MEYVDFTKTRLVYITINNKHSRRRRCLAEVVDQLCHRTSGMAPWSRVYHHLPAPAQPARVVRTHPARVAAAERALDGGAGPNMHGSSGGRSSWAAANAGRSRSSSGEAVEITDQLTGPRFLGSILVFRTG